ncbi:peptidase M23 [Roseobacter sp. HKCCA0434]|uniref:peptidase M23 n=1 Tax=Roseobacter sp. HKCCA0434 TaxID=3079297 RepID=UPI0029059B9B|nr:peptidase M23 [Roseobacter sp. HKCCA0434]
MKKLAILAAIVPGAALAHDGAHLHPHGYEGFALGALAVLALGALYLWARR